MFKWVKRLFNKNNKVEYDSNILPNNTPRLKIKEPDQPEPPKEPEPPKQEKKRIYMDPSDLNNIWLVVVDTTGLDKPTRSFNEGTGEGGDDAVDARKLGPLGIKTFAFVNAPDVNAAKGIFWRTLGAKNPAVRRLLAEIARATRVTNFSQIFPILTRTGVVWNYVGGPKEALPGQQSNLARQKELAGRDAYGNESAREYQPAVPEIPDGIQTKVSKADLSNMSAEDRRVLQSQQSQTPQMPQMPANGQMNQQQMMQMMQMMMAMMQNNTQPQPPPQAIVQDTRNLHELDAEDQAIIESNKTQLSPEENDPELQRQIQEMKDSGSKQLDSSVLDDEIDPAELARMAKMTQAITPTNPENAPPRGKRRNA